MQSPIPSAEALTENPLTIQRSPMAANISSAVQRRLLRLGLVLGDSLAMALAFALAFLMRFRWSIPVFQLEIEPRVGYYVNIVMLLIPLWIVLFALMGLYDLKNLLGGTLEYSLVFRATTVGLLVVVIVGFLEPTFIIARGWVLLAWGLTFLLTITNRFMIRRFAYSLRRRGYFLSPALMVGMNEEGRLLAQQLLSWKTSGLELLGFIDSHTPKGAQVIGKLQVLGSLDMLMDTVERLAIEELILATSALSREQILQIFNQYGVSEKVNLRMSSGLFEIINTGLQVKEMAYVPLVSVNKVRLTGIDRVVKFLVDYLVAFGSLIVISPLLLMIAVAVKLDSKGPVFHRRRVMGLNGRKFDAFKFRTMYIDGDEILNDHPELKKELDENHKLKEDPRITAAGKLLRRFSLDELPQLFNVLRHEMSMVGPRMISPGEMPNYDQWGINLLTVLPGITGLWQVSGRADINYQDRVQLDMYYIRNWTIWLDIQLLLQTPPAVLRGRGAY